MDSFTMAVVIGDVLVALALVMLIVLDKAKPPVPVMEPAKAGGKRSA